MKLKTQIFLTFLFTSLLCLILATISIIYLNKLGEASEKILAQNYQSVKSAEEMLVSLSKLDQILSKIYVDKNYNEQVLFSILHAEEQIFLSHLNICNINISEKGEKEMIQEIEKEFKIYQKNLKAFDKTPSQEDFYFTSLQRSNATLRESCVRLIEINHLALSSKGEIVQGVYFNAKILVFIITVFVLIIVFFALLKMPTYLLKPIVSLKEKIEKISKGEYKQTLRVNSNDELGQLANAFNIMSLKLQEYEASNIAEIKAQKSRIEHIIKSLKDGLIILDEARKIILVNHAACKILKQNEKQLIGKYADDIAQNNLILQEILEEVDKNRVSFDVYNKNNFLKIKNLSKEEEFYAKEIIEVFDNDKNYLGYILMIKDVTSFKASDEAKTSFIATASHELKTPLSALNMSLMLLMDHRLGNLSKDQSKIALEMKTEVKRLMTMVRELLDFSKIETGNIQLDKQSVNPKDIIDYALAALQASFQEHKVSIIKEIPDNLPLIIVDKEKISWVLINFLTNAIRYSPKNAEIMINIKYINDNFIEFYVIDQGPGIKKEDQKKIFQKFVQISTENKENKQGLGLGLAISKEIIDEHQGVIGVHSKPKEGASFYFSIPV